MQYSGVMRGGKRIRNADKQLDYLAPVVFLAVGPRAQSPAIDVLRDEILTTIEGAGLVHGHDMRVLAERGQRAHFSPESMTSSSLSSARNRNFIATGRESSRVSVAR